MQSLNQNGDQTPLSVQLASSMLRIPVPIRPDYGNTVTVQPLLNSKTTNPGFDASISHQDVPQTKLEEGQAESTAIGTIESFEIKSEATKDKISTSPIEEKKEIKEEYNADIIQKYEYDCKSEDVVKTEESTSLMDQSRKITKENINIKNGKKLPFKIERKKKQKYQGKKPTWKAEEDYRLTQLVELHGQRWAHIARIMEKTGKQVRDRYINFLRPGIGSTEWTEEEEKLLESLVDKHGRKWCKIASELPGRTENQVKNKFYCIFNKRSREYKRVVIKNMVDPNELSIKISTEAYRSLIKKAPDESD